MLGGFWVYWDSSLTGINNQKKFGDPIVLKPKGKFFSDGERNKPPKPNLRTLATYLFVQNVKFTYYIDYDPDSRKSRVEVRKGDFLCHDDNSDYVWEYFKENYLPIIRVDTNEDHLADLIHNYHEDKKAKRAPSVHNKGFTLPGYNFCGPGNSLDYVPTSTLDALCQMHDLLYTNTDNPERVDTFLININAWSNAFELYMNYFDYYFETTVVIPWIVRLFQMKESISNERHWAKALTPAVLKDFLSKFKSIEDGEYWMEHKDCKMQR